LRPCRKFQTLVGARETRKRDVAAVFGGMAAANTVYDTLLVIRLMDKHKTVLWAYDSGADTKGDGATKNLLKAIEKEDKAKRK
jgi:hypothetical protein